MPSLYVQGITCENCRKTLTKALMAVPGVQSVSVDIEASTVSWTEKSRVNIEILKEAIDDAGFDVL